MLGVRRVLGLTALLVALVSGLHVASPGAAPAAPAVSAFPSAQTIPPSGTLPAGGSSALSLRAARGEREGAWLVARHGREVGASIERGSLGPLDVELAWGHFVRSGARLVPDALLPWDGAERSFEQPNQPLYVRVVVPRGSAPGTYAGRVVVSVDGRPIPIPLSVRVFAPTLPERPLPTSFHVSPATYLSTVARLHGPRSHAERRATHDALFTFLAEYGISPSSWGFGEPRSTAGYEGSSRWWLDSATNMRGAGGPGFPSMRIPISSNRTSAANRIAGLDPGQPEAWCDYLKAVRGFWAGAGLARAAAVPLRAGRAGPRRAAARRAPVEGAACVLARRAIPDDRKPVADRREPLPLRRPRRRRRGHLGRPQPPLLRPVHGSREAAEPGARAGDDDPGRQARGLGLVVHLQRGRGHAGLLGHRAALEPASLPALERARGAGRRPLRPGHDELRRAATRSPRSRVAATSSCSTPGPQGRSRALDSSRSGTGSRTGRSSTSYGASAVPVRCGRSSAAPGSSARDVAASRSPARWAARSRARRSSRGRSGRGMPRPRTHRAGARGCVASGPLAAAATPTSRSLQGLLQTVATRFPSSASVPSDVPPWR